MRTNFSLAARAASSSSGVQGRRDRVRDLFPLAHFALELLAAGSGQVIELCAPVVLRRPPRRREPACFLETMERREKRSGFDIERAIRDLLNAASDAEPVHVLQRESAEDEEVERALQQ